jgi:hypothetical protein
MPKRKLLNIFNLGSWAKPKGLSGGTGNKENVRDDFFHLSYEHF